MIKIILSLLLLVDAAFASEDAPKLPPADQAVLDKAVDANLAEANKAYAAYLTAVSKAQEQVVKALEKVKSDAMKKGNLPLANAADSKIKEVKDGALAQKVTEQGKGDLLGEVGAGELFRTSKDVIAFVAKHPKWKGADGTVYVFDPKQMKASSIVGGKISYNESITIEKTMVYWGGCKFDFSKSDGKSITFVWPKGETATLSLVEVE